MAGPDTDLRVQLGFPLHTLPGHPGYVLVDAVGSQSHLVVGGRRGRLRSHSGAEQAFELAPQHVRQHYRFEFSQVPQASPTTEPRTLVDSGNSDGAACALALAKPHGFEPGEHPTVLVSCALNQVDVRQGLRGVKLMPVTDRSATEAHNIESLMCKWEAAQATASHGAVLVLHHADAKLLAEEFGLDAGELDSLRSFEPGRARLIAVGPDDMAALARQLGAEPSLFEVVEAKPEPVRGRRATDRGAGDPRIARVLALVGAGAALVAGAIGLWQASRSSPDTETAPPSSLAEIEGFGPEHHLMLGSEGVLRVVGAHLDDGLEDWGPRWCEALAERGLEVGDCVLELGPDGRSLDLPVKVPRDFSGTNHLPLPTPQGPGDIAHHAQVIIERELRVLYLGYDRSKRDPYHFLLTKFVDHYNRVHVGQTALSLTEAYRAQTELLEMKSSIVDGEWDIVRLTPYNYVYLRDEVGHSQLRMMICNNDETELGTRSNLYHANLFTRPGLIPTELGNDPDTIGAAIVNLAKERNLDVVWYFGQKHSTSGYVVPCGVWSSFVSQYANRVELNMNNDDLFDYVLRERAPYELRVGVMYDEKLTQLSARAKLDFKPQILWQSIPLPHGGIAFYAPEEPWRAELVEELLAFIEHDNLTDSERGEIDRFGDCATARFEIVDQWMWKRRDLLSQQCQLPYPSATNDPAPSTSN